MKVVFGCDIEESYEGRNNEGHITCMDKKNALIKGGIRFELNWTLKVNSHMTKISKLFNTGSKGSNIGWSAQTEVSKSVP